MLLQFVGLGIPFSRKAREEERTRREEERTRENNERTRVNTLLGNVIRFPGSVAEYSSFRGYDVEIVDTGRPDKGLTFSYYQDDMRFNSTLIEGEGVEAIVNNSPKASGGEFMTGTFDYGLPVRKK